jgi:hypothetical protein
MWRRRRASSRGRAKYRRLLLDANYLAFVELDAFV